MRTNPWYLTAWKPVHMKMAMDTASVIMMTVMRSVNMLAYSIY